MHHFEFPLPNYGKLALKGLFIGLIAVFLYDCMRVPFILAGVWGDFIPKSCSSHQSAGRK